MNETLRRILEAAIKAPSGENAQPWRFKVYEEKMEIEVHIIDEPHDPYSWGHRASYVAAGAAVENIVLAASSEGLLAGVSYFPEATDELYVARITLNQGGHPDTLAKYIDRRVTNRKQYEKRELSAEVISKIQNSVPQELAGVQLIIDAAARARVTAAACTNEKIMLANRAVHNYFFSHINWTKEDDDAKRVGFFIKTLELPPPAVIGFKLMRTWSRASWMNTYFKMNEIVAKQNAAMYALSPLVGAIASIDESPLSAVKAGRALQRLWLTVTAEGLSLQPMAGLPYLYLAARNGADFFSRTEKEALTTAYQNLLSEIAHPPFTYFAFRVGYSASPSAQATRFDINSFVSLC